MEKELIENLAASLHKNSFYDNTKSWDIPTKEQGWENHMTEHSKEEWRWMACRFIEIASKFKIKVVTMTNAEEQEDELRETKYPKFRILTGGKGPPEPPGENWLAEYESGTTFVSMRINNRDGDYELFHVSFKSLPDVMLLQWQLPDGKIWDRYVDPEVFSKLFKRGVVLGVIKRNEDGNSNVSVNGVTEESMQQILQEIPDKNKTETD